VKPEAAVFAGPPRLGLLQGGIEETFVYARGPMLIGVGERAFGGGVGDPEVGELAAGEAEAVTDFGQAFGGGELQVQHGDELHAAGKALGTPFAAFVAHDAVKGGQRDELQELGEEARMRRHREVSVPNAGVATRSIRLTQALPYCIGAEAQK